GLSFSKIVELMAKKNNANIIYLRIPSVSITAKKLLRPILRPLIKWSVLYAEFVKTIVFRRMVRRNTRGAGARKLLFQNSGRPQLKTIVPVMEEAGRDPGNDILFLVSKGSRNIENCEHGKIRQKNPDDYLSGDVIRRIRNVDRELRKTWKTLNKSSELWSIECRGVPLWDIFGEVVEHLWFNAFEPIAKFMVIAEKILSTEKPDCLIFTDPYEIFGRCLLLSANFKRIPSLQIQYAVLGGMDYRRNDVDKIAVSGEYFKEEILRTDPSAEEKIEVTGQPRYDVFKNCKTTLEELYSRYDLDPGKKVVLFASTCWSEAQAGSRHDPYVFYAYHFWLRSIYTALNR
ncbi:MAG: CDP-glycerol glycerophosphotransferase family protein, partial [Candidatus Omnitrophota bacterium]